jgi:hypothetical protein
VHLSLAGRLPGVSPAGAGAFEFRVPLPQVLKDEGREIMTTIPAVAVAARHLEQRRSPAHNDMLGIAASGNHPTFTLFRDIKANSFQFGNFVDEARSIVFACPAFCPQGSWYSSLEHRFSF